MLRRRFAVMVAASVVGALTLVGWAGLNSNPNAPFWDGPSLVTPIPPQPGFNPLTATNAQLIRNGFPPRPNGKTPRWWIDAVTGGHYVAPKFYPTSGSG